MTSWLILECIIPYLDVHKRLSISICSPWFRNLEKRTYIYFDELEIEPSKIRISDKYYKFGEILDIEKASELDDRDAKKIRASIRKTNFEGGNEWISMTGDLLEPGDIFLKYSSGPRLEQQKIEIMNTLRHSFMEELEKYSNSDGMVDPLPFLNIKSAFVKHPLLKNEDHSSLQQDALPDMYPNAFKLMKSKIEEMNRKGDEGVSVLEMLAYPPVTVPHFNQFTVFENSPEYSNRIPDGLSIRNAFKIFLSVILTGRKDIRIRKFKLEGKGIIPLPIGLKFDCKKINFCDYYDDGRMAECYGTLVGRVDRLNIIRFGEYKKTFSSQMVRNCKKLHIKRSAATGMENWESELQFLENEVIFMEISIIGTTVQLINSIRSWTSNTDRKIGSKLYIAFSESRFPVNTVVGIMSGELRGMGFIMKKDCYQSMYLRQAENKQVDLTYLENKLLIPPEFSQRCYCNRFFSLEIIKSKLYPFSVIDL